MDSFLIPGFKTLAIKSFCCDKIDIEIVIPSDASVIYIWMTGIF